MLVGGNSGGVVVNLSDPHDYGAVVSALMTYEAQLRERAARSDEERFGSDDADWSTAEELVAQADRVSLILGDISLQVERNGR